MKNIEETINYLEALHTVYKQEYHNNLYLKENTRSLQEITEDIFTVRRILTFIKGD